MAPVGLGLGLAMLALSGCGNTYRPVVSSINPVGPAAQPTKYALVLSTPSSTSNGLVNLVDFSGDTVVNTTAVGLAPKYLAIEPTGSEAYTLNADGTLNSFAVSTSLLSSNIAQATLPAGAGATSITPLSTTGLFVADTGRNAVAQFSSGSPPTFVQELGTGSNTVYTVGVSGASRIYALAQGSSSTGNGTATAIETVTGGISSTIPVGSGPVYGVMTSDARRAFVLNKNSGTVSVINAQANQLDTGVSNGTITVGQAPVWADFAPTLTELLVLNQGSGTNNGSVSVINIPLCSQTSLSTNPNCNSSNPVDAVGFGTVLATIPVGINPVMISVLQNGTYAYVANRGVVGTGGSAGIAGSVSVINLQTNTVVATLPASVLSNTTDSLVHGHPVWIASTTGIPTGKVYVVSSDSTDLTILRTDTNAVDTHLPLQGTGVSVRVTSQ